MIREITQKKIYQNVVLKNISPTFTSEAEGPPLMDPKKEENTFEILWNSQ